MNNPQLIPRAYIMLGVNIPELCNKRAPVYNFVIDMCILCVRLGVNYYYTA